jgi:hypothetical protein
MSFGLRVSEICFALFCSTQKNGGSILGLRHLLRKTRSQCERKSAFENSTQNSNFDYLRWFCELSCVQLYKRWKAEYQG